MDSSKRRPSLIVRSSSRETPLQFRTDDSADAVDLRLSAPRIGRDDDEVLDMLGVAHLLPELRDRS
jgi:hypothetical protein